MVSRSALIVMGGLAACAYRITGYPDQPVIVSGPNVSKVNITVVWTDDVEKIAEHCGHDKIYLGCAETYRQTPSENWCVIWVPQPKDFNDQVRLAILGHEAFHCFGASHARNT